MVSRTCGASLGGSMVRTKVTFTTESGTSTNALQCGFYAVRDFLCTTFHSKNHSIIDSPK